MDMLCILSVKILCIIITHNRFHQIRCFQHLFIFFDRLRVFFASQVRLQVNFIWNLNVEVFMYI